MTALADVEEATIDCSGVRTAPLVRGSFDEERGVAALSALPIPAYRGKPSWILALAAVDRLSASVECRYAWSNLQTWSDTTGLEADTTRDETGWFVLAHRA